MTARCRATRPLLTSNFWAPGGRLATYWCFLRLVQWLFRTINYWNSLVADKADSELLRRPLPANVHFGLHGEHPCWAKEPHAGLSFVRPDFDWRTHLLELRPNEGPLCLRICTRAPRPQ